MELIATFVISVIVSYVSALLAPKPKASTASTARDLDMPTVSAGRPIPVLFGDMTIKSPNVLWYGEKYIREHKVSS